MNPKEGLSKLVKRYQGNRLEIFNGYESDSGPFLQALQTRGLPSALKFIYDRHRSNKSQFITALHTGMTLFGSLILATNPFPHKIDGARGRISNAMNTTAEKILIFSYGDSQNENPKYIPGANH